VTQRGEDRGNYAMRHAKIRHVLRYAFFLGSPSPVDERAGAAIKRRIGAEAGYGVCRRPLRRIRHAMRHAQPTAVRLHTDSQVHTVTDVNIN